VKIFESLKFRDFRYLLFSLFFAMFGFHIQMTVRGILVYDITNNPLLTGIVSAGFAPSLLLFAMFGGVIGERFEKRKIIQITQTFNLLTSLVVAGLIYTNLLHWSQLLIISILQGAMFAMQVPARQALIPDLVGKKLVTNAIGLNAMGMGVTTLVGPAIGGYFYQYFGPFVSYLSVSIFAVIGLLLATQIPKFFPKLSNTNTSTIREVLNGFKYLKTNKIVRIIWIHAVVLALCSGPFRMLIPVYAKEVFTSNPGQVGTLMAAAGIGGIISSIIIASLGPNDRRGLILIIIGILTGVGLLMISAIPIYTIGFIAMIIMGLTETGRWSLGQALMMDNADDEYRARVVSLLMLSWGLMPLSMVPMGWAFGYFGPEITTLFTSIVTIIFALSSVIWGKELLKK